MNMFFVFFLCLDITAQPVVVQEAKSAVVIPGDGQVQLLIEGPRSPSTGFVVTVSEPAKFIRLKAQKDLFTVVQPTRISDTQWFFSAPPGTYAVTVTQFDPELGINEDYLKIQVDPLGPGPPPIDPGPGPPPSPVPSIDRVAALAPTDVVTAEMLINLYKTETDPTRVFERRKEIMRQRASYEANWNPFIVALNEELSRGDYVTNLRALAAALEKRITQTCVGGVCYKQMN